MASQASQYERVFKTAWFSKAAKKAHIADEELCTAIRQVMLGQADDLGGGVFKKRLGKNLYRSILLARGRQFWVYEYLFAKKDLANIEDAQLGRFRKLANVYAALTAQQIERSIREEDWFEICAGDCDDDEA
ncbi:MAG TPA: type II toxin-antitoxin system RelE/ParE family toxin [Acidobacteriaceae bacterium]